MPLSSSEIASMNGAYQGMAMNNMAYSNMIGMGSAYGQSDQIAGGMMNRGAAVGAPVMQGAMGLMGLDPLGMGFRAGAAAFGAGAGFGGAALAGAAVALPVAAGYAAAGYAGNQMYSGAQQQMALNNTLRGSFNFQNRSTGMTGFAGSEMAQMGGVMREMTHHFGPSGEMTSMKELTQLAGKMSSMGMAQGVRDVQEFSKRFKDMVSNLKTMARDLGTTLEGAMEFASAARNSGIFGMRSAQQFTSQVRGTALAGGLAVSEVTQAAGIGSQIARSVGGLGRQGAIAGMKTIGQIGTAQQMGLLSEEDIYNVTGMSGAEGRQAYASSQMQRTASFLKSGRGRRLVASVAEADGGLNEANIEQLMSGGMTISQTMALDKQQLKKIGRADFIRNEGRLRGAVMERIGAFLPAMQLQQWARGKGIDINDMDDRSMVFAQRQLGMGRDEVDQAIKMASSMPQILQKMRSSAEDDTFFQKNAQQRKGQGIEGLQNRFEQAKHAVGDKFASVGAQILSDQSNMIERWVNMLTDQYIQMSTEAADAALRNMQFGGTNTARREYGAQLGRSPAGLAGRSTGMIGGKGSTPMSLESFHKGGDGAGTFGSVLGGQSMASKFKDAGYSDIGRIDEGTFQTEMSRVRGIANGAQKVDRKYLEMGKSMTGEMNDMYTGGLASLKGKERLDGFREKLAKRGDAQSISLLRSLEGMPESTQATVLNSLEKGANLPAGIQFSEMSALPSEGLRSGTFHTTGDRNKAFAQAVLGEDSGSGWGGVAAGAIAGAAIGSMVPIIGTGLGAAIGGTAAALGNYYAKQGEANMRAGVGEFLASDESKQMVGDLFGGDAEQKGITTRKYESELQTLLGKGEGQGARAVGLAGMLASKEFVDANGDPKKIAAIREKYAKSGFGKEGAIEGYLGGVAGIDEGRRTDLREAEAVRIRTRSREEEKSFQAAGLYDTKDGKLTAVEGLSYTAQQFLTSALETTRTAATMGHDLEDFEKLESAFTTQGTNLYSLSVKEMREVAKRAAGTSIGARASQAASTKDMFETGMRKGNLTKTAAGAFGLTLTKDERAGMDLKTDKGQVALEGRLVEHLGGENASAALRKDVKEYATQVRAGVTHAGDAARIYQSLQGSEEVQKHATEKAQKQDEKNNPLLGAIRKNGDQTNKYLEAIVKSNDLVAQKMADLENSKKNPEDRAGFQGPV